MSLRHSLTEGGNRWPWGLSCWRACRFSACAIRRAAVSSAMRSATYLLFGVSLALPFLCFDEPPAQLILCTASGYMIQHITSQFSQTPAPNCIKVVPRRNKYLRLGHCPLIKMPPHPYLNAPLARTFDLNQRARGFKSLQACQYTDKLPTGFSQSAACRYIGAPNLTFSKMGYEPSQADREVQGRIVKRTYPVTQSMRASARTGVAIRSSTKRADCHAKMPPLMLVLLTAVFLHQPPGYGLRLAWSSVNLIQQKVGGKSA